mgnify:CR=1 FL=1
MREEINSSLATWLRLAGACTRYPCKLPRTIGTSATWHQCLMASFLSLERDLGAPERSAADTRVWRGRGHSRAASRSGAQRQSDMASSYQTKTQPPKAVECVIVGLRRCDTSRERYHGCRLCAVQVITPHPTAYTHPHPHPQLSLKAALDMLGYRTYHMKEVCISCGPCLNRHDVGRRCARADVCVERRGGSTPGTGRHPHALAAILCEAAPSHLLCLAKVPA